MIKHIYSIVDIKANYFGPLVDLPNDASAIRFFGTMVNDRLETSISIYPEDFALYEVCHFDDETGIIDNSADYPRHIVDGRFLKKQLSTSPQAERQSEPLKPVDPVDNSVEEV